MVSVCGYLLGKFDRVHEGCQNDKMFCIHQRSLREGVQALLDFQYVEPNGKDQGINVRKKAESLLALLNDRGKIRELRQKSAANRDKYVVLFILN